MSKLIAVLRNEDKEIQARIYQKSETEFTLSVNDGLCSLDGYYADFWIKHDGCSHWWFNGADCSGNSYYHICGIEEYLKHFRYMLFAYAVFVATKRVANKDEIEKFEKNKGTLEGYAVEIIGE